MHRVPAVSSSITAKIIEYGTNTVDYTGRETPSLEKKPRVGFCSRSSESSEAAREERLKVSGNPSQYDDLTPFIREQELMRELTAKLMLPSLTLDISDDNIPAAVEHISDWLEASGGLYMPDLKSYNLHEKAR